MLTAGCNPSGGGELSEKQAEKTAEKTAPAAAPGQAPAAARGKAPGGPGAVGLTPGQGAENKLAGRVFRMPAGGKTPDPKAVMAAIQNGQGLPAGIEEVNEKSRARDAATEKAKKEAVETVTKIYGMIAGKPMDVVEVTESSGLWRVTFQTRGVKEAPSTVHVSKDGKLAFEGGFELQQRHDALAIDHRFAQCLHVRGVTIIGDGRTKATKAQLKEVGSFAGKIFVDCARGPGGCEPLMKKLKVTKLPVVEQGEDRFTGPRPRRFLETLSGCK